LNAQNAYAHEVTLTVNRLSGRKREHQNCTTLKREHCHLQQKWLVKSPNDSISLHAKPVCRVCSVGIVKDQALKRMKYVLVSVLIGVGAWSNDNFKIDPR